MNMLNRTLDSNPFLLVDSIYFLTSIGFTLIFHKYIKPKSKAITKTSSSSCDSCILGTASKLHRHLVICTGEYSSSHWISHLENADNTIFHSLRDDKIKIKDKTKDKSKDTNSKKKDKDSKEKEKSKLLISAVEYSFTEQEIKATHHNKRLSIQVGFVYPEGVMIELPPPDDHKACKEFREELLKKDLNINFLEKIKVGNGNLPWSSVILVCNHMSRDKRCGRAGPLAITALQSELEKRTDVTTNGKDSIRVFGCSHIGGHKYAATLAIYPQGDWVGKVTKKNAKHVIDCTINGTGTSTSNNNNDNNNELASCLRGNVFDW